MILSIGMIVKNEEKYLCECLEALTQLRKKVSCELIIVDTGSDDSTVDIARRYTDKVYSFEWCDDFSAARNETLKHASGKWYMMLDADEIFESTSDIEQFFISGEYKHYNSASYIIKSYSDKALIDYLPFDAVRLMRRTDDLHFENPVHEHLTFSLSPICKRLSDSVKHYGYIDSSGDEMKEKREKYKRILYSEYEDKKNDADFLMQLYDIELGSLNYKKAAEYALRCIEISENNEVERSIGYMLYADTMYVLRQYDKIFDMCGKYFAEPRESSRICDMPMYMYRGVAHFNTGDYKSAAEDFELYFRLRTKYMNVSTPETYTHPIKGFENYLYILRILECAVACEQTDNSEGLYRVLSMEKPVFFDNETFFENGYTKDYVTHAVLLASSVGDRRVADAIASDGTDREKAILKEVLHSVQKHASPQDEFAEYAAKVKQTIRAMAQTGMKTQAAALLNQYKDICPNDTEIPELDSLIR